MKDDRPLLLFAEPIPHARRFRFDVNLGRLNLVRQESQHVERKTFLLIARKTVEVVCTGQRERVTQGGHKSGLSCFKEGGRAGEEPHPHGWTRNYGDYVCSVAQSSQAEL